MSVDIVRLKGGLEASRCSALYPGDEPEVRAEDVRRKYKAENGPRPTPKLQHFAVFETIYSPNGILPGNLAMAACVGAIERLRALPPDGQLTDMVGDVESKIVGQLDRNGAEPDTKLNEMAGLIGVYEFLRDSTLYFAQTDGGIVEVLDHKGNPSPPSQPDDTDNRIFGRFRVGSHQLKPYQAALIYTQGSQSFFADSPTRQLVAVGEPVDVLRGLGDNDPSQKGANFVIVRAPAAKKIKDEQ